MAKYERRFKGDFNNFLHTLQNDIMNCSASVSSEDESNVSMDNIRVAIRVYERYSMAGGNRVSLSITLVGNEQDLFISAITSGGSQAVFFKINTWGEETFLEKCSEIVENYIVRHS